MPECNLAITNHHDQMALWWKKPEYIKARKEFCKRSPVCVRCGRKCQTPGHSAEDYRHGYEHYLEQVRQDCCDPLCNQCNRKEAKSMKPCPISGRIKNIVMIIDRKKRNDNLRKERKCLRC
jgi:hypothetical protein